MPEPVALSRPPAKLAVFVSGGGSNLKALHAATQDGRINGSIVVGAASLLAARRIVPPGLEASQSDAEGAVIEKQCGAEHRAAALMNKLALAGA